MKHSTLLRDTNSLPSATSSLGSLGVLTTDSKTPVVPQKKKPTSLNLKTLSSPA